MNIFKAAYCRVFQLGFRVAIPFMPYRTPEELTSLEAIPEKLRELGIGSALLVTDKTLRGLGLTAPLEKAMEEQGVACHVYDRSVPNPTISNVEEAFAMYNRCSCGAIIGFGGGGPMDCAKAAGARVAWPKRDLHSLGGNLRVHGKLPPLFAVPTTAGTGSETTLAAIIVDDETRHKFSMNDFSLIPRYAVLDARVTEGLPPFYTATTGMDAMTHAVEAFIGQSTTRETRDCSIQAVKLILEYLPRAYRNGHDLEARQNMLRASYLAGRAFTVSYVGYCHAVAHSLGGLYNTPHGLANSVILPYVLRAYGSSVFRPLKKLAVAVGLAEETMPESLAAEIFIRKIEEMNRILDIPDKLPGIRAEDIYLLSRRADREGNPLYPVPRLMDRRELERFYVSIAQDLGGKGDSKDDTDRDSHPDGAEGGGQGPRKGAA